MKTPIPVNSETMTLFFKLGNQDPLPELCVWVLFIHPHVIMSVKDFAKPSVP